MRDGNNHLILALVGMGLYVVTLLFGIAVIGDNAGRSAVMAGVIVAIAACGYIFSRQPSPKDK